MTLKHLFLYTGIIFVFLFVAAIVTAQEVDIVLSDFFTENKETIEINRFDDVKGRFEYGYKIDHGTWSEETYYYGETLNDAQVLFSTNLSF